MVRLLVAFAGTVTTRVDEIATDWPVVGFAIATAFVACALTSMAPLWQAARTLPNDVLSEGVRASAGARSGRLSRSFVVAESRSPLCCWQSAPCWSPNSTASRTSRWASIPITCSRSNSAMPPRAFRASQASSPTRPGCWVQLEAIPGVTAAGVTDQLPLDCCLSAAIFQEGPSSQPSTGETVAYLPVSLNYFRTMEIPLRRGRLLTDRDNTENLLPVVINQAAVKRYWPDRDPVGAVGHFGNPKGDRFQVVGVVGDVRNRAVDSPTVPEIYMHSAVTPMNPMYFAVRSALPPETLIPAVRRAIRNVNPAQPIHDVKMMTGRVRESVFLKVLASSVMTFFALAALLMATLGTYGVVSYSVRQRTVEMGTRMALGATSRDLLYLVTNSGLRMAAYGVGIGGVAAIAATWLLVRQFHIENPGVLPFSLSAAVLAFIAFTSSLFPAWRATLLSPMVAIRNEPGSMWEVFERWSATAHAEDLPPSPDADMMTALVEASRHAAGFREADRAALEPARASAPTGAAAGRGRSRGIPRHRIGSGPGLGRFDSPKWPIVEPPAILWRALAGDGRRPRHGAPLGGRKQAGAPHGDRDAGKHWRKPGGGAAHQQRSAGGCLAGLPVGRDLYTSAEKRVLRGCADQFALLLENARLTDRVVEQEKGAARSRAGGRSAKAPAAAPGVSKPPWRRSPALTSSPPAAWAGITTISWISAATTPASRWPTSRAKAFPPRSSCR